MESFCEIIMAKQNALKKRYQKLTRQQLLDGVYELGVTYEKNSYSCSQCTVKALHEMLAFDDSLVRAATSLCGGVAFKCLGSCGALLGGIMVLDNYFGRDSSDMSEREVKKENIDLLYSAQAVSRLLYDKFVKKYGDIICARIQYHLFGRVYFFEDPDELKKFVEAGGHTDSQKCAGIVGTCAKWVMEILIDKGVVIPAEF